MLTERVRLLTAEMDNLAILKEAAAEAARFETRVKQLEKPLTEIGTLGTTHQILRLRSVKIELDEEYVAALQSNLEKVAEDFKDNPKTILQPDQGLRSRFWIPLEQFPDHLNRSLLNAWKLYVNGKAPRIAEDILLVLGNVPAFREQVRTIGDLLSRISVLGSTLPKTAEAFDQVEMLTIKLTATWRNLQGDGIPRDVLEFIKKAADGTATYKDLSDSILTWLQSRNLLGMLRITFR